MSVRRVGPALARACPLAVLAALLAGCSGDRVGREIASMNDTNIKRVSNLYAAYMARNGWKGPKDEATFKTFIKGYDPEKLQAMKVDAGNPDPVFTSERDGKPFKIRYNVGGGPGAAVPVTFEEAGKDGKKQVGFTNGTVEDVDDARYKELFAGGGSPASPSGGPPGSPPAGSADPGRPKGGAPAGAPTGPPGK